jgi:hypothetical protein
MSSAREGIIGGKKKGYLDSGLGLGIQDIVGYGRSGTELHDSDGIATKLDLMGLQVGRKGKRRRGDESATNKPQKNRKCVESDVHSGISTMGFPPWFAELVTVYCPDMFRDMTRNPNYGSRPSSSNASGVVFFQLNHSKLCVCSKALSTVPFVSHRVHTNNGVLFCTDKRNVYVSCMSATCIQGHLNTRECHIQLSNYIEKIYEKKDTTLSKYASSLFSSTDKRLLSTLGSMSVLPDISTIRMVPSCQMDIGLNGKRTWIRLNKDILESYFKSSQFDGC